MSKNRKNKKTLDKITLSETFENAEIRDDELKDEIERLERKSQRRSKIVKYLISQLIIFIVMAFAIVQISNMLVKSGDYKKHYGITVSFTESKDKKQVEEKVKAVKDISVSGIDTVGIFDKQYKIKFDQEPTPANRADLERSLKKLAVKTKDDKGKDVDEVITLDDAYQYNRQSLNVNLKDYIIYIVLIILITISSGFFIRYLEELMHDE